ncbi:MAG: alpha/beta hydrolase [Chloroflexi bacterium]|nr:alpha/beta hydrolase [Chloroflexota bacterium]
MTTPQSDDSFSLDIIRVGAQPRDDGAFDVAIDTTRGMIPGLLHPHEGGTGAVVWVSGAIGGVDGPAKKVYATLAAELATQGITSLRLNYRMPGELEECVLDTLAGVSLLKGIGAERIALVGHSFGGAVVITAGGLSDAVSAVVAMSSQTFGATGAGKLSPRPLLVLHGDEDALLPYTNAEAIYEWAGQPKEVRLLRGGGHGLGECAEEVRSVLREWLLKHLAAE